MADALNRSGGPRHGSLLMSGYLRPWAERIAAMVGAHRGEVAVDVMCDSGITTDALSRGGADVVGIDTAEHVLAAAAAHVRHRATLRHLPTCDLPFENGTVAVVTSLFTIGLAPSPARVVEDIRRILAPNGRVAIVVWSPTLSAEQMLTDAFSGCGLQPPLLGALLRPELGDTSWLGEHTLRDVARFDTIEHFWLGLVIDRPLGVDLTKLDPTVYARIKERCASLLAPHTAADGTLRLPVEALCLTR